jgi:hypothetical protein
VAPLVIRDEQMAALRQVARREFRARLVRLVRRQWAADYGHWSEEQAQGAIRAAWRRALGHGLESDRHVYRYVNLCCLLGWDFEAEPAYRWVVEALGDAARPPERRLDFVLTELERRAAAGGAVWQ